MNFISILSNHWQKILILSLFVYCVLVTNRCSRNESDKQVLRNAFDKEFNEAKYYKRKDGQWAGQVKAQDITIRQLKDYSTELGIDKDKLTKQIGRLNNLVTYWKGQATVSDTISVYVHDTVKVINGEQVLFKKFGPWTNDYLSLDGELNMNTNIVSINYDYKFDFELTGYYKPRTFGQLITFKPKQLVGDITFNDPNLRVSEFRGVVIKTDSPKFFQRPIVQFTSGVIIGIVAHQYLLDRK